MSNEAELGPDQRARAWTQLQDGRFDVLVIGGGVTGAGTALDAATRGLRTALVEQRDWASGTSSRSSKLIHGGLRYLEQLNFSLVHEALKERGLLINKLCPHLVRPIPFLYPLNHRVWERAYVGAGMLLYDVLAGFTARAVPFHRHYSRRGMLKVSPGLKPKAFKGALQYWDAQEDDARHTMMVGRTAARYGAVTRTSTEVVELLHEGDRVVGAKVRDVETGESVDVRAKVVINCTGVWTDELQHMAGGQGAFKVRASKGVHVVIPRDRFASESGLITRAGSSVLFVIPWGTRWIIGTTDTDWNLDLAHPAATARDIDYILEQANKIMATQLTRDDVRGVYAGLRPLLAEESEATSKLSREHAVARTQPGLVSIAGGKYTTYRVMGKDAVDAAGADLGTIKGSVTQDVPILGAEGFHAMVNQVDQIAAGYDVPSWRVTHLLERYGSLATELLDLGTGDRTLLEPLEGAEDYLRAEILYAVTHEGALHLDDVLARRTRMSIEYSHRGVASARAVAGIVAPVLGWDAARVEEEITSYTERVQAERASQQLEDDQAADAARRAAPDSRPLLTT